MKPVAIQKVNDSNDKTLPVFDQIAKRFDAIQRRAFGLFEKRGYEHGHDVEDWLQAENELMGLPPGELAEKDGAYRVRIPLPGFKAKQIDVTATPGEILVHAASTQKKEEKTDDVLRSEFGSSDVYRCFEVPTLIDVDKVTAKLDGGILLIDAPEVAKPEAASVGKAV